VIRTGDDGVRELVRLRWGMPTPYQSGRNEPTGGVRAAAMVGMPPHQVSFALSKSITQEIGDQLLAISAVSIVKQNSKRARFRILHQSSLRAASDGEQLGA
jgi:hypothetical protein